MKFYQHRFDSIEDYLHHRSPYLLVDAIDEIQTDKISTRYRVTGDEQFVQGHFPGAHILPGAIMQEITTQTAGILIAANYNPMEEFNTHDPKFNEYALGVLARVNWARYKGFARPGDELKIVVTLNERVETMFDFNAAISVADKQIMKNSFRLTNILSKTLIG
jgi:3-hydroxyacyl-[acyl-carrier-protein] dehydratase